MYLHVYISHCHINLMQAKFDKMRAFSGSVGLKIHQDLSKDILEFRRVKSSPVGQEELEYVDSFTYTLALWQRN